MNVKQYSYQVLWSEEDGEFVGLCAEFPSLSWLDKEQEGAFYGIVNLVSEIVADMEANSEPVPLPLPYQQCLIHTKPRRVGNYTPA